MTPGNPIDQLIERRVQWLTDATGDANIVSSTRVRLARNIVGFPFPGRADESQRRQILARVTDAILTTVEMRGCIAVEMTALSELDRLFLLERHLISRELCNDAPGAAAFIASTETTSIMVNEEDHLRLQIIVPGLQVRRAWEAADCVDNCLGRRLEYAYSDELGFLTSCPSNIGTGIRASAMVHLPALALSEQMDAVNNGMRQVGFTIRGLYGEGTESLGNLFQISNQSTLGENENYIIVKLERLIKRIIEHEKNARQCLLERHPTKLLDYVSRAYGALRHAYILDTKEAINSLSALRLGIDIGTLTSVDVPMINELLVTIQAAHLQKRAGRMLNGSDRDSMRAELVRKRLRGTNAEGSQSSRGPSR